MKWIIFLLIFFFLFNSCDTLDKRLKVINHKGLTGFCIRYFERGDYRFPTCSFFNEIKEDNKFLENSDTTWFATLGNWDNLLEKKRLLVYFFDSAKFENYCKGIIPIDSTYNKYYFTKKELIDNNWTIILK